MKHLLIIPKLPKMFEHYIHAEDSKKLYQRGSYSLFATFLF